MTEQIKEQVSAFLDDELSTEECEFFVRRLQRDQGSRNLYMRYHAIGAAMRGEPIYTCQTRLRDQVQLAIAEPVTAEQGRDVQPPEPRARRGTVSRSVAGTGIAAAVAAIALFVIRPDTGELGEPVQGAFVAEVPAATATALERVEPPSYVVPLQVPAAPVVKPDVRLTGLQYLMYHGGHASSLSRTVVHSNVLATDVDDFTDVTEVAVQ